MVARSEGNDRVSMNTNCLIYVLVVFMIETNIAPFFFVDQIYYYSDAQTTHTTYPDGLEVLQFPRFA